MKVYETREMWLAAALELMGHLVTDIAIAHGTQATFIIEITDDLDPAVLWTDYVNNRLEMPVFALKEKVKELRTRLNKLMEPNH